MSIIWDPNKELKLRTERNIEIQEIADLIISEQYLALLENPNHETQQIFIVPYHEYIHVVPFVIDENDNIILKTVFPSRRFHKLYGESNENET